MPTSSSEYAKRVIILQSRKNASVCARGRCLFAFHKSHVAASPSTLSSSMGPIFSSEIGKNALCAIFKQKPGFLGRSLCSAICGFVLSKVSIRSRYDYCMVAKTFQKMKFHGEKKLSQHLGSCFSPYPISSHEYSSLLYNRPKEIHPNFFPMPLQNNSSTSRTETVVTCTINPGMWSFAPDELPDTHFHRGPCMNTSQS